MEVIPLIQVDLMARSKLKHPISLKNGDKTDAVSLWHQAHTLETNDAEPLIYLEDQRVVTSGKPYITLVVGTMLTGNDTGAIGTGRSDLQGAYVAQKEYNDGFKLNKGVQIRLLIANSGNNAANAIPVAEQIIQVAKAEGIVGVMGWPFSGHVQTVFHLFDNAHIPMVSPTASSDDLTNVSRFFFRVVPSNKSQAIAGAQYAETQLKASRAALFVAPNNTYSRSLAKDFQQKFTSDGNQIVATENYKVGTEDNLPTLLHDALSHNPDLIYFSGYAKEMSVVLSNLPTTLPNLKLLGGDALYELNGYASSAMAGFDRLRFTAFAFHDEWGLVTGGKIVNPFFDDYTNSFSSKGNTGYGYSLADSDVILSYDATKALLEGCKNALGERTSLTTDELQQGLTKITGSQAIQGVSGQIAFSSTEGSKGDPINKAIIILRVDSQGQIGIDGSDQIHCFVLSECSN